MLRVLLLAVLASQAALCAWDLAAGVAWRARDGVATRFTASRDARFEHALGGDAEVLFALRDALPARAVLLTREVRDMEESALVQALRHALYPIWVREVPAAVLAGGLRLDGARPVFFLDLDAGGVAPGPGWGDPEPVGPLRLFRHEGG